jgi:hypothetical protein
MAWTTPRTWNPGETVTASLMNVHLRDQLNILKTQIRDDGALILGLGQVGFSAGQGNNAGGADTQLTSYDVTIPAGFCLNPGDMIVVEGVFTTAANGNTKTCKIQVGGGTSQTVFVTAGSSTIVPFRVEIRRRTSTTGSMTGVSWIGAASGGAPTNYMINVSLGTVAFGSSQTLKIFAASTGAADLKLTDYNVYFVRSLTGTTV